MNDSQPLFRSIGKSTLELDSVATNRIQLGSASLRVDSKRSGFLVTIACLALALIFTPACKRTTDPALNQEPSDQAQQETEPGQATAVDEFVEERKQMVAAHLVKRDIVNQRVLDVMQRVPRHQFVPPDLQDRAYIDRPLPIGDGQTISQPYIVALMTQLVDPKPNHKALDIGTGSGYQAAVLAELVKDVYSIEIVESLADQARERLKTLQYDNVRVRHGDGYDGWESEAPFDVIIVAAAPDHIPQALIDQLAPGGKLVIPVGDDYQTLKVVEKKPDGTIAKRDVIPVIFVPMTGKARQK